MSRRFLFDYRLDAVEWAVLLSVCVAVLVTLKSMSFEGPGVLFGGIPPGLGAVWLLRRFRPSLVAQPPPTRAPTGEGSALLSLLVFAIGSMLALMTLFTAPLLFADAAHRSDFAALPLASGALSIALFYGGVRLRRGGSRTSE